MAIMSNLASSLMRMADNFDRVITLVEKLRAERDIALKECEELRDELEDARNESGDYRTERDLFFKMYQSCMAEIERLAGEVPAEFCKRLGDMRRSVIDESCDEDVPGE